MLSKKFQNLLNLLKKQKYNAVPYNTTNIYRKASIEGRSIPGIIRNGRYFFSDLEVYEDGRVECWGLVDIEQLKVKVQTGWISSYIPDGDRISVHNLGDWKIKNGKWHFDQNTFTRYIYAIVKELNPHWENIYKHRDKIVNGIVQGELGRGKVYDPRGDSFFKTEGDTV
jgi:hypothetical protein